MYSEQLRQPTTRSELSRGEDKRTEQLVMEQLRGLGLKSTEDLKAEDLRRERLKGTGLAPEVLVGGGLAVAALAGYSLVYGYNWLFSGEKVRPLWPQLPAATHHWPLLAGF